MHVHLDWNSRVVQCCADEVAPSSDLNCELLRLQAQGYTHPANGLDLSGGWSNARDDNDPVCAASLLAFDADGTVVPPDQRCQRATRDAADTICLANSARLCTRFELKHEAPNTGTNLLLNSVSLCSNVCDQRVCLQQRVCPQRHGL